MLTCPACHLENPAASNFCSACGRSLRAEAEATATIDQNARLEQHRLDSSPPGSDSSHHGRFLPGTILGDRYRIISLLGKGAMGEVYKADDLRLATIVALKFLPAEFASDAKRLAYFVNEVRLARQVSHPNVCRVYDIGEFEGAQYISMEYVDGEDLRTLLRRIGRLPKEKTIELSRQLFSGLSAAHEKGVLHRDLKPGNVMVDGRGQLKITDFGLACSSNDAATQHEIAGTPAHMAPEQLLRGETSQQSDLYSAGLILYELLTGERVCRGQSWREVRDFHEQDVPITPPSALIDDPDPRVEQVLLRCLARAPKDRPVSAAVVLAALPGGDALAAALAAGTTPSPELVAAAGGRSGLPTNVAITCLGALLVLLAITYLVRSSLGVLNQVDLLPPTRLRNIAVQWLEEQLQLRSWDKISWSIWNYRWEVCDGAIL